MRDIKFRAWNKRDKKLEPVNINDGRPVRIGYQWFGEENSQTVYNSIPEQYTGLKDKNGVEIYEGDIVKSYYFAASKVHFENSMFMASDIPLCQDYDGVYTDNEWEIIGNIHKNQELLPP